jgi:uncharacterized protein (UPF0147 family)
MQEMEEKIGAVRRLLQLEAVEQELRAAAREAEDLGEQGKAISLRILKALSCMEE